LPVEVDISNGISIRCHCNNTFVWFGGRVYQQTIDILISTISAFVQAILSL